MANKENINDLLSDVTNKEDVGKQLLMLYGRLNQDVIVSTIKLMERKLLLESVPVNIITKAKIVSTEMLQNVLKHETVHETHLPNFILRLTKNGLSIVSNNIITEEDKNFITSRIENFSKIDNEDFRAFYIESFKNASISSNGNAGLGLLDIFYRSKKKVRYKIESISAGLFSYNLDVTISQSLIPAI